MKEDLTAGTSRCRCALPGAITNYRSAVNHRAARVGNRRCGNVARNFVAGTRIIATPFRGAAERSRALEDQEIVHAIAFHKVVCAISVIPPASFFDRDVRITQ